MEIQPQVRESSYAKVALMKGAVYRRDVKAWRAIEAHHPHIKSYFQDIGLELIYSPEENFAFLRQVRSEASDLPTLITHTRLSIEVTTLGLVLADELKEWRERLETDGIPTITRDRIRERMDSLIPQSNDARRRDTFIERAVKGASDYGLIEAIETAADTWEIMPIVKARFSLDVLEDLRQRLRSFAERASKSNGDDPTNGADGA